MQSKNFFQNPIGHALLFVNKKSQQIYYKLFLKF